MASIVYEREISLGETGARKRAEGNLRDAAHGFATCHSQSGALRLGRGQTREICEKQEKYLKGKVVTFTVQSLILCQYAVDLLTFLELYLKSSKYLKMGKFGPVGAIRQSDFVRVRSI